MKEICKLKKVTITIDSINIVCVGMQYVHKNQYSVH